MKRRFGLSVIVLLAAMLALVGALREVNTSKADTPPPVKPASSATVTSGSKSTALGDAGWSFSNTTGTHGRRGAFTTQWGHGSRGNPDIDIRNGDALGEFTSYSDVFCDASDNAAGNGTDLFADKLGTAPIPWAFTEEDTDLYGNGMGWLVPKTSGLGVTARFQTIMNGIWLNGDTWLGYPLMPLVPVNILTLADAWAPHTGPSQIFVSGAPTMPSILCTQDAGGSWATNTSETNGNLTTPLPMTSNSPLRGDAGSPCSEDCTDFVVLGFWGTPSIAPSSPAAISVTSRILNSGPAADGDFKEIWQVEAPSGVTASWGATPTITKQTNPGGALGTWTTSGTAPTATVSGTTLSFHEVDMLKNQSNSYSSTLNLTCSTDGDYIVAIKSYAYPEGTTQDNDLVNNMAVSALRIKCITPAAAELDFQSMGIASALWSIDTGSAALNEAVDHDSRLPPGDHVQLFVNDSATLRYGAIVRNQSTTDDVPGKAIISAASATDNDGLYEIGLVWDTAVTGKYGSEPLDQLPLPTPTPSATCRADGGQPCAGLNVSLVEPAGHMISLTADLEVTCTQAGKFVMLVKIVNQAVGYGDPIPINNTFFEPAVVYCWNNQGEKDDADDGIDDSAGIYPSWTTNDGSGTYVDARRPISPTNKPATAIGSDIGYAERFIVGPSCYYYDATGIHADPDDPLDWVTPAESRALAPGGIDDDGDCLADKAVAQPGNAVDPNDLVTDVMCPEIVYNEGKTGMPTVQYTVNADEDCDGLVDGIEAAFGSDLRVADTDGDTLTDFYEMFLFTSPVNPDTDGDGFKDMPASTYQNSNPAFDNCPGVYNPTQLNSDGKMRDNGPKAPGNFASNPNQDKLGDLCDDDDDNDNLIDTAEALCMATYGAVCDPLVPNTDGNVMPGDGTNAYDRTIDGIEVLCAKNPTDPVSKCGIPPNPVAMYTYLRGCHLNLPGNTDFKAYNENLWVENDADGDGIACTGTPPADPDSDNGTATKVGGVYVAAPLELSDSIEALGYGTAIARKDTDGDGCEDWIEVMDINGDRKVAIGDQTALAKRAVSLPGFEPDVQSDAIYDVNKDGKITVGDQTLMAKNTCGFKPTAVGCGYPSGACPLEN